MSDKKKVKILNQSHSGCVVHIWTGSLANSAVWWNAAFCTVYQNKWEIHTYCLSPPPPPSTHTHTLREPAISYYSGNTQVRNTYTSERELSGKSPSRHMTPKQRRINVAMSHPHWYDIVLRLFACWAEVWLSSLWFFAARQRVKFTPKFSSCQSMLFYWVYHLPLSLLIIIHLNDNKKVGNITSALVKMKSKPPSVGKVVWAQSNSTSCQNFKTTHDSD